MQRLIIIFFLSLTYWGYAQTQIEILRADELVYNREVGKYQRCIGNVRFKQDQVYMDCDSAWFYEEVNRIEAFGNIYIRQADTFDLRGEYLEYDGDSRIARVEEEVRLSDDQMLLKTERLDYDLNNKSAYYVVGGEIFNGDDFLSSMEGTYYSRSKQFHFSEEVQLTNPEYTMESDTLHYYTVSKTAYFFGPTYIHSEENTIFCNYGWYNTQENTSQFSKGAYIEGKENRLEADSMRYNRNTGYGEAFHKIKLTDTVEHITIYGAYGNYQRFQKRTMVTGQPVAIREFEDDSLYLKADTMIDHYDSLKGRMLYAFHAVEVFKSDLQARSDSLNYQFADSIISLYTDPVVWSDSSQITGDTIHIYQNQNGLDRMLAYNNGFLIEKDPNGKFNQIKGKTVTAYFVEGDLDEVHVNGNGQSVYYALDDSTNYSGVNDILCGRMIIYTDSTNRVKSITFLAQPKAMFYPLEKFPQAKSRLGGFLWRDRDRPLRVNFNRN